MIHHTHCPHCDHEFEFDDSDSCTANDTEQFILLSLLHQTTKDFLVKLDAGKKWKDGD